MIAILFLITALGVGCYPASVSAREPKQVRAFRYINPCPATAKTAGACPGWVVDHIVPLCLGGADVPANMQWQDREASLRKGQ